MRSSRVVALLLLAFLFGGSSAEVAVKTSRALARRLAGLAESAVLVAMGEVTPENLENLGFDCYVNTACPRLAYDDQLRFPVPVLAPPEFEILCGARAWEDFTIDEWD